MGSSNQKIWFKIKKIIESVSKDYDEKWRQRKKRSGGIGSRFLINFIFQLTLNSQKGYGIILSEMWDDYVAKNIKTPQENSYAISSICEARQKLPEFIFKELNEKILTIYKQNEDYLYKGKHRVFAVDGSKVRLNKELEKEGYKVLNQGAYYPSGLLSCLYEVESGIVHDFSIENNMSERASALEHIKNLQKNDLVVLDRGYFSYLLLKTIEEKKAYSLFRMQQHMMNKEIEEFLKSREEEQVIIYKPSNTVQHDLKKRGHKIDFAPVKLRLLRMKIEEQDYIFGTTLIGEEYDKESFANLYHRRWNIEELYKVAKETLNIEKMHAKTERGIKQEIYAHFVLINIARLLEENGNTAQELKRGKEKINFKGCIAAVERCLNEFICKTYNGVMKIIRRMSKFISKLKYKVRPNRKFLRISYTPHKRWRIPYGTIKKSA